MTFRLAALAAVILSSAVVATATAGTDPVGQVYYVNSFGDVEQAPRKIFLSAGAGPCMRSLDWRDTWGADRAVARGNYKDNCTPPIGFKTKVKVVLRRIGECEIALGPHKGQVVNIYKRATYTYRHGGERVTKRFSAGKASCR